MKVGIIDDQEFWGQRLEKDIRAFFEKEGRLFQIQTMTRACSLLEEYQDGYRFDLLFIDIQMKDLDGIDLGKKIRDFGDNRVHMVYVSAFPELAYQAINNDVIGFIDKASYKKEEVEKIIKRTIKKLDKKIEYYVFYQDRQKKSIDIEKILYFF